ncbi:alanine racemase [[Bacillus] enclensis]|uniref:Alanine racemase n=1 Tax=[Bacillus] enclensis TaxID=1402860 RepID=A0A0V8H6E4_9BACI|nr:alanine racemase [[Bacillus] enclensis]KSU58091.1 alanine racemase [[Bacillus] enclensis]SCC35724.1 alanine racemase [[Bacillus] enclensis]
MEAETQFFRDTWAEINLDHLTDNIKNIKRHIASDEVKMFAVVKANAYGHGDLQVAEAALEAGVHGLAVAFLDEAVSLRKGGIEAPILVLGASRAQDVNLASDYNVSLTAFDLDWLKEASKHLKPDARLKLHIKCDTGMGRIGIRSADELKKIESYIHSISQFEMEGIFTHYATADELDDAYLERQLGKFNEMLAVLDERPEYVHSSNSAAVLRKPDTHFNAVRVGIAMYGLTPSQEMKEVLPIPLKEVFSLYSRLIHTKEIKAGDKISYGATYEASENEWIGTIPIGYADGWIRKLQGQEVIVDGKRSPIVGRICMDQCMISLPRPLKTGEKVTLIGRDGNEAVTIDEIAGKLETINYEIPCIISARVPRIYIRDGKPVKVTNKLLSSG